MGFYIGGSRTTPSIRFPAAGGLALNEEDDLSRMFELLNICTECGRHSFASVVLFRMDDTNDGEIKFCSRGCKVEWRDTHPSDMGDTDPRIVNC